MLQVIGKYSRPANDDPYLHLRYFMEVASNLKIPNITNGAFRLRLLLIVLMDPYYNSIYQLVTFLI